MKLKPMTVADIAALAACYREIDAAAKANNDGPMMAVAFGQLAGVLDRINLGKRPKAFSDMTLPEFLRAVVHPGGPGRRPGRDRRRWRYLR